MGRHVVLDLEAGDQATALEQAEKIAETLLANPVIEDWSVRPA
ncbi:MAG: phosphoribosylformylglycinamidine synthase subunit PurS [Mycobacteriales bacterium]